MYEPQDVTRGVLRAYSQLRAASSWGCDHFRATISCNSRRGIRAAAIDNDNFKYFLHSSN
jgi:hypothetical protein